MAKNCFVAEVAFKLVFKAYTIDQFLKHKKTITTSLK